LIAIMLRIAIIGAGPSGFFTAGEILKKIPGSEVHMFEKRVAPYGLVRYGVAPDHQLTRRAIKMFEQIAGQPGFHYHGNVEIGPDVSLENIYASFHAVVICTGAEMPNRPEITGSRLPGVVDALDFSRWTNGECDAFNEAILDRVETAVIIGNGNVALDAARMLARPSVDWVATDIAPYAMEALIHHRIKHIVVVGRRGPLDVSFTEAELLEVAALPGWDVHADGVMPFGPLLEKPSSNRRIEFKFHLVPDELCGSEHVTAVQFVHADSGEMLEIPAQLVIFATGHRGIKLDGLSFDQQRGIIPHDHGRVTGAPGYYVCGWIKRGAKGLIGQNRKDAIETIARVYEDRELLAARKVGATPVPLNNKRVVTWDDWKKIDAMEIQHGSSVGRPRINFTEDEALALL